MRDNSNFDNNGMPHTLKIHQYLSLLSSNTKNKHFFIHCLIAQRPNLNHFRGQTITHPISITEYCLFQPDVTRSPAIRFGCKGCLDTSMVFEPGTSYSSRYTVPLRHSALCHSLGSDLNILIYDL